MASRPEGRQTAVHLAPLDATFQPQRTTDLRTHLGTSVPSLSLSLFLSLLIYF